MNIAIIPARGGSKRIPRKNIRDFCGKPMIEYAISVATESNLFDRIIVSTDDEEIAQIARGFGVEVPFIRPSNLSDDYTATVPVVAHAINVCHTLGWKFDNVCCIYPCVPFLKSNDLREALHQLGEGGGTYCFPVTEYPSAIQRSLRQLCDGKMQPFYPEFVQTRTQDLEPAYYDAGQFYWGKAETWLSCAPLHSVGSGYLIPSWRVVDIDSPADWRRAEILYKALT